jgi:formylglycine-generating enzyme required for sulfatase activity/transposase-like protein
MGRPTPAPPTDEEKSALVERIIRGELTPEQAQQQHGLSRDELKDWVRIYRREARRAFDDRVKMALLTQGIDMAELSAAEFSGNVEDMSVAELLQTIQLGEKDAEIRIEVGSELGHIWCIAGQVVDAESHQLRGAPAVYRLLGLERGRIHADFGPVQRARRNHLSTTTLLMEGARRFDECVPLRARLGDPQAVFVPSDRSLAPNVQATSEQFAVLRLFDGIRTLEEVVQHSPLADLETLTNVIALRDKGLLERVRPSRTSLRELPGPASETEAASFLTSAQSLAGPERPRHRWLWAVGAVGSVTLCSVVAVRFVDAEAARARAGGTPPAALPAPSQRADRPAAPDRVKVERALTAAPLTPASPTAASPTAASPAALPPEAFPICPEGSVLLGYSPLAERPPVAKTASIAPFCMARAEVTVAEYERCRERGACEAIARDGDLPEARLSPALRQHAQQVYASQCNAGQVGRERHPVNCVSYRQASAYCAAAGGRLPTEAEWDLAARGSEERRYPWGDGVPGPTRLNACGLECKSWYADARLDSVFGGVMYNGDDGFAGTAPVASYPAGATRDGVYDLLGNVAEWTATSVDFGQAQPEAASAGTFVVRGGSFSSGADAGNIPALRLYLNAESHGRGVGFRCAYASKELR